MDIRNEIEHVIKNLTAKCQVTKTQIDETVQSIMAIIKGVFVPVTVPESLILKGIHTKNDLIELNWESNAVFAHCTNCGEVSTDPSKLYYTRTIQDFLYSQRQPTTKLGVNVSIVGIQIVAIQTFLSNTRAL